MATTAIASTKIFGGSFLLEERRTEEVFTPEDFSKQRQLIGHRQRVHPQRDRSNIDKMEHKDFSVTRNLLKKAGELGLSGVEIPEAYGGLDWTRSLPPLSPTTWPSTQLRDHLGGHTGIGTLPILYFGTEDQKKKYLPRLAAGEIDRRLCLVGGLVWL